MGPRRAATCNGPNSSGRRYSSRHLPTAFPLAASETTTVLKNASRTSRTQATPTLPCLLLRSVSVVGRRPPRHLQQRACPPVVACLPADAAALPRRTPPIRRFLDARPLGLLRRRQAAAAVACQATQRAHHHSLSHDRIPKTRIAALVAFGNDPRNLVHKVEDCRALCGTAQLPGRVDAVIDLEKPEQRRLGVLWQRHAAARATHARDELEQVVEHPHQQLTARTGAIAPLGLRVLDEPRRVDAKLRQGCCRQK